MIRQRIFFVRFLDSSLDNVRKKNLYCQQCDLSELYFIHDLYALVRFKLFTLFQKIMRFLTSSF